MMQSMLSKPRRRRSLLWREALDGWLFILPWLLGFIVFVAGPMLTSAALSFMQWEILTPPKWIGLGNFAQIAADPLFRESLWNTVYYTALGVPIYLTVALLLNMNLRGTPIFRTIYFLPSLTPAVANALLWLWIFNPDFGLANALLNGIGLPGQTWLFNPQLAKLCLVLMGLWGAGQQMVIFLAGWQGIPREMLEAASIDGANDWQRFWRITVPLLSPTIFFNLVIGIIGSFQVFTVAYIATQGGPQNATLFYVLHLYRNAFEYFKMGYASAMAWVLFVIILAFTLAQFRLAQRFVYYEAEGGR